MNDESNLPANDPAAQAIVHHVDFNLIRAHLTAARSVLVNKIGGGAVPATAAGQLLLALEGLVEYLEVRAHPSMLTYVPPEPKYRSRK